MRSCHEVKVARLAGTRRSRCCGSTPSHAFVSPAFSALWLIAGTIGGFAGYTHAQDTLEEIEVIGTNYSTPLTGEVVESEHTGTRRRINRNQLEQPGSDLGNVLSSVSGVQQQQSGGFGTYSSVTVRGASAAQTAVFLDGILLNTSGRPIIDLSTLEILNLDSVDIYKGNSPLQLGHAGIGGAVNLNTPVSQAGSKTTLRLGAGSFSQASLSVAQQTRIGKWDWTGLASHQQSDNDFPYLNNNPTPRNPDDDKREKRQNNQVRRSAILLKGGHQWSNSNSTNILLQVAERDVGVPTVMNIANKGATYETLNSQLHLSQTIDQWRGWNTRHTLYWHQSDSLYDDPLSRNGLGAQRIDADTTAIGTKAYWERFFDAGTFGLSVDMRRETLDQVNEFKQDDNVVANRNALVATAQLAITDTNEKFLLTPAIRWQQSRQRSQALALGVPNDLPAQGESELGAQLGARMNVTPRWKFSANAGSFFREPAFAELFGSTGLVNGNPRLVPEEGINMDASVTFNDDKLQMEATVFHRLADELIVMSYDARGIGRARNTGKAVITGLELSTIWAPSTLWQIKANLTLQKTRNRDPFSNYITKILPGEASQSAFARIQFQPSRVAYWYEWQAARDKYYDSPNILPAADASLHHLGLDIKHGPWKLGARLHNAGNDIVEDFNGFHKPGRSYFFTLTRTL